MAASKPIYNFADMRFSGTLQQNQPISDGAGGQVDNWVNILTTRCGLVKESGKLVDGAGKLEYNKFYTLVCRKQIAVEAVLDTDSRWLINSDVYKVTDYERVDMIPHYITFQVTK